MGIKIINPAGQRTCKDHSLIIRRIAGWSLATIFHHYFGDTVCVLVGAGTSGDDLSFAATEQWIKTNHVTNLGITQKDGEESMKHIRSCSAEECVEAAKRLDMIAPLLKSGKLPGDDGASEGAALVSVFASRQYHGDAVVFDRKSGLGEYVDAAKPFFEWFKRDCGDWEWHREI